MPRHLHRSRAARAGTGVPLPAARPAAEAGRTAQQATRARPDQRTLAVLVLLLLVVDAVALGVSRGIRDGWWSTPPAGVAAASPLTTPGSVATPQASTISSPIAMPVPTPEPTATAGAGFPAQLTARQLRALLLTPQDLDAQGDVSVVTGVVPRTMTAQRYAAAYTAPTDPAACRSAEGLLAFRSTDSPTSVDWMRTSIQRSTDLRLRSSTLRGDQQVRQFSSAEAAQQFLRDERDWFTTCSTVQYDWGGGRSVTYQGQVDQDLAPDALLTSGTDSGSGAVSSTEFDGWVRDGRVVYGAYLLGDRATSPADLRAAGRALMLAGLQKLQAAD